MNISLPYEYLTSIFLYISKFNYCSCLMYIHILIFDKNRIVIRFIVVVTCFSFFTLIEIDHYNCHSDYICHFIVIRLTARTTQLQICRAQFLSLFVALQASTYIFVSVLLNAIVE